MAISHSIHSGRRDLTSRRSVDDIADMMETAEDDEDEAADAPETPSNAAASAAAPSAPPAADAAETPIRARGKYLVRVVAAGDKEAVKQYLLTEPVDDMWQTTLDMEERCMWCPSPRAMKTPLTVFQEFASILRQRPELKKFVSQVMKREMNRKIAALTGRKKKSYRDLSVKHHPDKSSDSGRRFQQLRDAFEILEDPVKLLLYDTGGLELLRRYEAHAEEVPQTENLEISHQISLEDDWDPPSHPSLR
eukprot:g28860.t1